MAPSRQRRRYRPPIDGSVLALLAVLLVASPACANEPPPQPLELQLEVSINGQPTRLIGAFVLDTRNRLSTTREELTALGLIMPGTGPPDAAIFLDEIEGLTYRYDEIRQSVAIAVPDKLRLAKNYSAQPLLDEVAPESSTGVILNYSVFSQATHDFEESVTGINGGSLSLDARAYSPFGTLSQSGLIGTTTFSEATALRLDTIWSYADEVNARSWRVGDITSGGLAWTRPIRMGGAQVQRNFSLRPNLITMPLPSFSGSAALPSTVDVYVNNVKTYSQAVEAGPYHIENLPVITGSGTARVVVTDSSGRETERESEFFTSPDLLRRGLYDYSFDLGVARLDYGTESFAYDEEPLVLGSLRYGVTDRLTGELHAESDLELLNGGFGIVAGLGSFGEVTAALAASSSDDGLGGQIFAGWNTQFDRLHVSASTRRTFGDYEDLASVTSDGHGSDFEIGLNPRAIDQVSLSYGFPDYQASASIGFVHVEEENGDHTLIGSGSLAKSFGNNLSLYASGFLDVGNDGYGIFAGLSYTLGHSLSASSSASLSEESVTAVASLSRSRSGTAPGSYGWRISKGEGGNRFTSADASYQSGVGLLQAGAFQQGGGASLSMAVDGSVAAAGGGVFLGNRIDEAFAVVDVGSANVPVRLENREIGATRSNGKLLVTGLKAYQKNKISIDIANLPVMADIPKTETRVVPRENSGVTVDFGIKTVNSAAIVIVTDNEGERLPAGTAVTLKGHDEPFLVGFDGEVYMTGLGPGNEFESVANSVVCSGAFSFKPAHDEQQVIGPVKCG